MGQGEIIPKRVLDGRVAALLGKKKPEVAAITDAFLKEVLAALVATGEVRLDGLGHLHLYWQRGARATLTNGTFKKGGRGAKNVVDVKRKYRVSFRRAAPLRDAIRARYGRYSKKKEKSDG